MRPNQPPLLFAELCYALSPADIETLAGRLRKKRATAKNGQVVDQALREIVAVFYEQTRQPLAFASLRFTVYRLDETAPTFACQTEEELQNFIGQISESPDHFVTFDQGVGVWKSLSDFFDPR